MVKGLREGVCGHLANINAQILLVICPVADGQTQLLLLTGLVELHLLRRKPRWRIVDGLM